MILVSNSINESYLYLCADDAKLFKHILDESDGAFLQNDLTNLQSWLDKWLLKLNINKCKVVSYGSRIELISDYCLKSDSTLHSMEHLDSIKDLGVLFDSKLKFDQHIIEKVNKAYSVLGLIHTHFRYMSSDTYVI